MTLKTFPHKGNRPETPVDRVIRALGAKRVAVVADVTTEAVRKWNRPRRTGGGGGLVPSQHQAKLLEEARRVSAVLTEADMIGELME